MEENNNNSKKDPLVKMTIRLKQGFKDEMIAYKEAMGFGTRSEMIRTSFIIMKEVLGPKRLNEPREPSLAERLSSIEKRLNELQLEATLIKKQKELVKEEIVTTKKELDFDEVTRDLLNTIRDPEQFNGSVKDFAIMEYFKDKYSRGVIFYMLTELEKKGILSLDNGVWKIIE